MSANNQASNEEEIQCYGLFVHYNVQSMGHLSSFPAELVFPLMLSLLGMWKRMFESAHGLWAVHQNNNFIFSFGFNKDISTDNPLVVISFVHNIPMYMYCRWVETNLTQSALTPVTWWNTFRCVLKHQWITVRSQISWVVVFWKVKLLYWIILYLVSDVNRATSSNSCEGVLSSVGMSTLFPSPLV